MMTLDPIVATAALAILAGWAVLSLLLILSLGEKVRLLREHGGLERRLTLPMGRPVPEFAGRTFRDGRRVASEAFYGTPAALVFLNASCSECRKKIPEIEAVLSAVHAQEMLLWIVDVGDDIAGMLPDDSPLLDHALLMDLDTILKVNPRQSAPFYLFIDNRHSAVASNFIGDENWLSFLDQMREAVPLAACV